MDDEKMIESEEDVCRHRFILRTSAGTCRDCGERVPACPCGCPRSEEDPVLVLPAIFTNMVPSQRGRFELEPKLDQSSDAQPRGVSAVVRSCATCGTLYAVAGESLGRRFRPYEVR